MKNSIKKRNVQIILPILFIVMALSACVSSQAVEETDNSNEVIVEEQNVVKSENDDLLSKLDESASVEETIVEVIEESSIEAESEMTMETVVYEGIDMESSLPAAEWVNSSYGIIEEPKFVITNAETTKKIIVEDGQEALFESGDVLGIYIPSGILVGSNGELSHEVTETITSGFYAEPQNFKVTKTGEYGVTIATMDGEISISCILNPY